ncbi:hypothetical protein QBC36DRAFT_339350 [Triangularia setosa]|uniref:Fibroblast growth factor n=1 Tax=Triangularia setosa TaxID=2587417 RepID=A0AAN6VYM3_9PEZI|nr:hypothetical protein QBC36DRAFT_339350 [Podospora setosa]
MISVLLRCPAKTLTNSNMYLSKTLLLLLGAFSSSIAHPSPGNSHSNSKATNYSATPPPIPSSSKSSSSPRRPSSPELLRQDLRLHLCPLSPQLIRWEKVIPVYDTEFLNGLLSVPTDKNILLSAGSIRGRVLRINLNTGNVSTVLENSLLALGGQLSLYCTVSGQGYFGRAKMAEEGFVPEGGKVEVLARTMGEVVRSCLSLRRASCRVINRTRGMAGRL